MISEIVILLVSIFSPQQSEDLRPLVSAQAAYVINTELAEDDEVVDECCGICQDGVIVHADGHVTECPCPETCKCKSKTVRHPASVLHSCETGKCRLKQNK